MTVPRRHHLDGAVDGREPTFGCRLEHVAEGVHGPTIGWTAMAATDECGQVDPGQLVVRRAGPADLATLVELHRAFCVADDHPFDEARARAAFVPLLVGDDRGVVWIVDEPAAYAVLTWGWSIEAGGPEAVLDEVYVTTPGRGVGGRLIDHVVADGQRRGLVRIYLETETHNARARRLYGRHGFAEDDSIWMSVTFTDLG
jgi:GNAT superfamily N-acetyltransferase